MYKCCSDSVVLVSELPEGEARQPGGAEAVAPARWLDEGWDRRPFTDIQRHATLQERGTNNLQVQKVLCSQ